MAWAPTYSKDDVIVMLDDLFEAELKQLQWVVKEEKERYSMEDYNLIQQLFYHRWQSLRGNRKS
jgi:hypothetical protein